MFVGVWVATADQATTPHPTDDTVTIRCPSGAPATQRRPSAVMQSHRADPRGLEWFSRALTAYEPTYCPAARHRDGGGVDCW